MKQITRIGLAGMGRMGLGMAERWRENGIEVIGYDLNPEVRDVDSLVALVRSMPAQSRVIWLMLPTAAYPETLRVLMTLLGPGDMIIDGGNSRWQVTQDRHEIFARGGIHYVDVGTSGGIYGRQQGYALMVGATDEEFEALSLVFEALVPAENGLVHVGQSGAGHFAKEVHNGIEYGMMGALAEGFSLLSASEMVGDPTAVLASWRHGSIVTSLLLNLTVKALQNTQDFDHVAPVALDSGEGRWTLHDGLDLGVPTPVISAAVSSRLASQGNGETAARVVAAMRREFGGHAVVAAP